MLHLHPSITGAVGKSVLITGATRSGTTMMGQLVHSLDGIEYIFEPPFLFSHLPLIEDMEERRWRLLFETYLFEDFLMEAVAGRRLNLNQNDDSSVFVAKPEQEIMRRLERTDPRGDLEKRALSSTIAFKIPDILGYLSRLKEFYPELRIIIMLRGADAVVSSVERKGWFSNESLAETSRLWPSRRPVPPTIPFWVPENDVGRWESLGEIERGYYYYVTMYRNVLEMKDMHLIDYESFVREPHSRFANISTWLGAGYGDRTEELLSGVYRPELRVSELQEVDRRWRRKADEIHERCREMTNIRT